MVHPTVVIVITQVLGAWHIEYNMKTTCFDTAVRRSVK